MIILCPRHLIWWTTTTIDGCHNFDKLRLSNLVRTIDVVSWNVVIETVLQSKFDWQQTIPHTWDTRAHAHNYEQRNRKKQKSIENKTNTSRLDSRACCRMKKKFYIYDQRSIFTIKVPKISYDDYQLVQIQTFVCLDKSHRNTVL
jgi:hypothetical protein